MTESEADEALAQAIRLHAVAYDIADPDSELLGDYAVVASWVGPSDDDEESRYTVQFHRRNVPQHVAVGLFTTALGLLVDDD